MKLETPSYVEGFNCYAYPSIDSTNDEAKRLSSSIARIPSIVTAAEQTKGRGRYGRSWESTKGNFFASLLLPTNLPVDRLANYSFVTAIALGNVIYGLLNKTSKLQYKWPNDILVNGCKLAGILLETHITHVSGPSKEQWLVIGVGVNLASSPEALASTSISLRALDILQEPHEFLPLFLRSFNEVETVWKDHGFENIRSLWLQHAYKKGETITVKTGKRSLQGVFIDIDLHGGLVVKDTENNQHRIMSGEVFLSKLCY